MNNDMVDHHKTPESDVAAWCLQQPAVSTQKLKQLRPGFLVISPGKTGSTWLADKLRRHPQLFIPDIKEVRFFSSFFESLDLDWYLDQFAAAADRTKGEASPSYAILPTERIRLIRCLMPEVKLIFLMREPVARAWSHAKHCHRYREANFFNGHCDFASVSDDQWRANFSHDWTKAHGDYLGQLHRWRSVFPRDQMFVSFYENIGEAPDKLLRDIFAFLGVDPNIDLTDFHVRERVFAGRAADIPNNLALQLHAAFRSQMADLDAFLRREFACEIPAKWMDSPSQGAVLPGSADKFDDERLSTILKMERTFAALPDVILRDYRNYSIVSHRDLLYGVEKARCPSHPEQLSADSLTQFLDDVPQFAAKTLAALKGMIDTHLSRQAKMPAEASPFTRLWHAARRRMRLFS